MPVLAAGYSDAPPGHLLAVVTTLEMRAKPANAVAPCDADGLSLKRMPHPATSWYRALFRTIGQDWLWFSRLRLSESELRAILDDGRVEVYALTRDGREIGLLELDFREAGACELAFLGVTQDAIGSGAGQFLIRHAIARAWSKPISRFWVHTCSLDHPRALGFYRRAGLTPIKLQVETFRDPRLDGVLPRAAAPHIPIIE